MTGNIENTIQKRLAELPPSIRTAIAHIDYPKQVASLMHKYNLRVDQAGILDTEIMLVLLGLEHPDALARNLAAQGGLSKEIATAIMGELNESVFKAIRHEIVEIYEKEKLLAEILGQNQIVPEETAPLAQQPPLPPRPVQTQPVAPLAPQISQKPRGLERTMPQDLVRAKLEQSFRLPPEVSTVTLPQGGPAQPKKTTPPVDPYREPIG